MLLASLGTTGGTVLVLAGLGAGIVNGIAGGGSLISFPALLAFGYSPLVANVSSTVGILPGALGGVAGFRGEIDSQRERLRELLGTVVLGAIGGGALLLTTPAGYFSLVVPYLILGACVLFALQPLIARRFGEPAHRPSGRRRALLHVGALAAAAYGAYFGAGLGIVLIAVLGTSLPDSLVRLSGLRIALALVVNGVAAVVFALSAPVAWVPVGLMAGSSVLGGYLGARIARAVRPAVLRVVVVTFGVVTAAFLLAG